MMNPNSRALPELLAPAGSWDSLVAAVNAGADAVYLGMGRLNARASAQNFDRDSVRAAIDHCHAVGVRVYATLNTLLLDKELSEALDTAAWLRHGGIDALIIQDIGLTSLLRQSFPELSLHASTQMSVHTADGARFAGNAGCDRVVLARECSLADIQRIAQSLRSDASPVALEVFVHGALCVSVSGQCLHSSFIGRRSGNRGLCAQPCRMEYRMGGDSHTQTSGRLLSMKDLALIDRLDALIASGVASLKIEGRMKPPAYVARVVQAYRRMLDAFDPAEAQRLRDELERDLCRAGGCTHGYGASEREDLIFSGDPSYRDWPKGEPEAAHRKRAVHAVFRAHAKQAVSLELALAADPAKVATVFGPTPGAAQNASITADKIRAQLGKLGDTPFALERCDIDLEDGLFLPASALNALRRDASDALQRAIVESAHRPYQAPQAVAPRLPKPAPESPPLIVAQVGTIEQAEAAREVTDAIAAQPRLWNEATLSAWAAFARQCEIPVCLSLPPIALPPAWERMQFLLQTMDCSAFAGATCGNAGQIAHLRERFAVVHGDHTLNVCNAETFQKLRSRGLERVALSVELNAAQIRDIARVCSGAELAVYGNLPTMQLAHCPVWREGKRCGDCDSPRSLTDRTGMAFALMPFHVEGCDTEIPQRNKRACTWQLLGGQTLDLARYPDELRKSPVDAWRLLFYRETPRDVRDTLERYRRTRDGAHLPPLANGTGGHFHRGF